MQPLKKRTLRGILWNGVQRFGTLAVSLAANLVLVRMLTPEDFGCIGILLVFVAVSQTLIDGGFTAALIQKKEVSQTDYSTVFYWNLILSVLLIGALALVSPLVAAFYRIDALNDILRAQSVVLLINSFCIVQTAQLIKKLEFKVLAIRSVAAAMIGAIVAILLAYRGWGVWSLVVKELVASSVGAVLLWSFCKWHPSPIFSWRSFRGMFRFGSMIFVSDVINTLYQNMQALIIGRAFSVQELGYYSQARKLEEVPVNGGTTVLTQVLFPVYSSIADQYERLKSLVRKNVVLITYLSFSIMFLLIVIARPLLLVLFTDKWAPAIPLFQILCFEGVFYPLNCANALLFKSLGNGKVYFILQSVKRLISLLMILYSVRFGLYGMMWAIAAMGILSYAINLVFTNRIFGYRVREQLSDILPNLLLSVVVATTTWGILRLLDFGDHLVHIVTGSLLFGFLFMALSRVFGMKGFRLMLDLWK